MTLEKVTKELWDKTYNEVLSKTEKELTTASKLYLNLLKLMSKYRIDYKTHRVIHELDYDKGIISYKKSTERNIGYKTGGEKDV